MGEFWFITLGLCLHPSYSAILFRLSSPSSTARFLDLGTCLGQDLRKLIYDGAASQNLFGCDVFFQFENVGYELFRDRETFLDRLIVADLFDTEPDGALVETEGTWDMINITMFLHAFDWDTQIRACKRILRPLSQKPASMVIGAQTGSTEPGEHVLKPPFAVEGQRKTVYRHSQQTFIEMWKLVEKDEGTQLKIQVQYEEQKDRILRVKESEIGEKQHFFTGEEQRRLFFTIELL